MTQREQDQHKLLERQQRRGYRDLAQSVIETAVDDLPTPSRRKELARRWEGAPVESFGFKRERVMAELSNDARARVFLKSEMFELFCLILNTTSDVQLNDIQEQVPHMFLSM